MTSLDTQLLIAAFTFTLFAMLTVLWFLEGESLPKAPLLLLTGALLVALAGFLVEALLLVVSFALLLPR